jgi:ABC-2 type transport system ATP-binding protein
MRYAFAAGYPMIEAKNLSKSYGAVEAVRDISFRVDEGTVTGFLGPNGAGKSTTLRMLSGYLAPTAGTVTIAGHDIDAERLEALRHIGYMPETSPLYVEMKVREYLSFRAELKRVPRAKRRADVDRALELARVADFAGVTIGHLSKGYRQRVGLADALLGSPRLLILDEPTAGLDPNQIREVRALIESLAGDHTVLLSTHILSEVEAVCSRAIVIAKGKLVAEGPLAQIKQRPGSELRLVVRGDEEAVRATLEGVEGVADVELEREGELTRATVALADGADAGARVEAVVAALTAAKLGVREVLPGAASLEQVFSQLTEEAESPESRVESREEKPE